MEKGRPWCGQPSDRGRLKNRTEHATRMLCIITQVSKRSTAVFQPALPLWELVYFNKFHSFVFDPCFTVKTYLHYSHQDGMVAGHGRE